METIAVLPEFERHDSHQEVRKIAAYVFIKSFERGCAVGGKMPHSDPYLPKFFDSDLSKIFDS